MRTPACSSGLGGSGREGSPVSLGSSQSSALHHSAILKVVLSARSCCARSGPDGDGAKSYQHKEKMRIAVSPPVGSWGDVVPFVFCLRAFSREHLVIEVRGADQSPSHSAAGKAGAK